MGRWVAISWLVVLVACSSERGDSAGSPSPPAVAASVPASPSADPLPAVPATSAGSLDSGSVPSPDTFGAGWVAYIDPGAAADGYLGNGAFVRERDGAELVASLIPFGCADVAAAPILPRPQHALEATYRHESGAAAVVVVLAYPDEADARSLLRELGAVVSACPPGVPSTDPAAPYRLSIDVVRKDQDQLRDTRSETGQDAAPARWVEVAVREEARVALAIVEVRPGADDPNPDRLSDRLRDTIRDT